MAFHTYIIECSDGSYYCGYAVDLNARVSEHNHSKIGARYTRSRRPVKLVYSEEFPSKSLAMKREAEIKKLTRAEKELLVGA